MPIFSTHRSRWLTALALSLAGTILLADQWQRRAAGPLLKAEAQSWSLGDSSFPMEAASLNLVPHAGATVITGRFSRSIDAAPDSLPAGVLLETLLPDWQKRSAESARPPLPSTGNSMQERLRQEALRSVMESAQSAHAESDKAQALQWLSFRDRQFIAHLAPTGIVQVSASLAHPGLPLQPGSTPGSLLLGAATEGRYLWSQSAFVSADHGHHWQWQAHRQLPRSTDLFGWTGAHTSFAWNPLEQALLISYDSANTWGQPAVTTPLTMATSPEASPASAPAPLSAAAWQAQHALKAFAPSIWGDLPADPSLVIEYETLLTPSHPGQLRGWSTRWTRTLDAKGTPQGEWQAALTRRFTLSIPPSPVPVQISDIATADDLQTSQRYPRGQLLRSSDGSQTWLQHGSAQYLDPQTWRWQAPVRLPRPLWHHSSTSQLWTGKQVWISRSSSPALLDLASCLLPRNMPLQARCKQQSSQAFHLSRDQGRSWQGFDLPQAADSHIVGWDEEKQRLLVAEPTPAAESPEKQAIRLVHYAIP